MSKNCQILNMFCQSGKISPNLVALFDTEMFLSNPILKTNHNFRTLYPCDRNFIQQISFWLDYHNIFKFKM